MKPGNFSLFQLTPQAWPQPKEKNLLETLKFLLFPAPAPCLAAAGFPGTSKKAPGRPDAFQIDFSPE
ncbi:MAG: hypothetical protein VZQ80_04955 [Lachnospiraceae bacterium]|nr:hypothetical protein [Lachnospiraceae bacterium]